MERAGLISSVKAGQETRYSATDDGLEAAAIWLIARGVIWDKRLARLSDLATGGSDR